MRKLFFIFLCVFLLVTCNSLAFAYPKVKVTAKVVDETGNAIKGVDVHISFEVAKAPREGWGTKNFGVKGVSDEEGFFTGEASASSRIGVTVRKEGYYLSRQLYEFTSSSKLLNRWEPWNPTVEVVMKKKRNPVAMYQKNTSKTKIPVFDTPIGFDLEKGDWMAPYGKGIISDFIFTFHAVDRAYTDYECSFTLTFSNEADGLQEYFFDSKEQSYYKWPFEAHESGYENKIYKEKSIAPGKGYKSNEKKNVNYLFRVRTKIDKDGKIVDAKYGKIEGEFGFDVIGNVRFLYYFNPDGTRNLEEDSEKNLLKKK